MDSKEKATLKLQCLEIVLNSHKGENRSNDFLIQKATGLFQWVMS